MSTPSPASNPPAGTPSPSASEIRDWMVERLSQARRVSPDEIRTDEPLAAMGLDSMQFVVLVGELEDRLGCRFAENPLFSHPTIDTLSNFLSERLARGEKVIDPATR